MESSEIKKRATSLGKLLVEELRREPDVDTLSRWMAHYVAEQIAIAENSTGSAKDTAEDQCFQTILALWAHRFVLPNGRRPFEEFEPIFSALARLDPDKPSYYHRLVRPVETARKSEATSVEVLIEFIFGIDHATRILIKAALSEATSKAKTKRTKAFLANAIPSPAISDVEIVRILTNERENSGAATGDKKEAAKRAIQDRIAKLDMFASTCRKVREAFAKQLAEM
jgi:hypothetical protein